VEEGILSEGLLIRRDLSEIRRDKAGLFEIPLFCCAYLAEKRASSLWPLTCFGEREMLHALISTENRDSGDLLQRLIRETGQFVLERVFSTRPTHYELGRALNTLRLDVVFLDVTKTERAESVFEQIRRSDASLPIIGFSTETSPKVSFDLGGVLEVPFSAGKVTRIVRQAIRDSGLSNYPNVTAIMPAKAGGGATTIAINVAFQLSRSFRKKVLVVECDLQSGTISERVGSRPGRSISETLECADVASTLIWPQHVFRKEDVDFLTTKRATPIRPPAWHDYMHLLRFVAGRYDHILLDLPDVVTDATAEAVHAASSVYIMTTPEPLSLSLVSQRLADLEAAQVDRSRVRILVNQWQSGNVGLADLTAMLGCDVAATFPNDYRAVNTANVNQSFVDSATRLGKACRAFSATLSDEPDVPASSRFGLFLKPLRMNSASHVGQRG